MSACGVWGQASANGILSWRLSQSCGQTILSCFSPFVHMTAESTSRVSLRLRSVEAAFIFRSDRCAFRSTFYSVSLGRAGARISKRIPSRLNLQATAFNSQGWARVLGRAYEITLDLHVLFFIFLSTKIN